MSADPSRSRPSAGTTQLPVSDMPASLKHILLRMHAADENACQSQELAARSVPHSSTAHATETAASEVSAVGPSSPVVPTAELLNLVDEMYFAFRDIASQCAHASLSGASPTTLSSDTTCEAAHDRALSDALSRFDDKAVTLQAGIRTKLQQTARFALLAHLRSEIATRQRIVTRLEVVLETARKNLHPPSTTDSSET